MKRLAYSPRVFAFIRAQNEGPGIVNVSNDIVSGEVQRKINDLSQASLVLQNHNYKYINSKLALTSKHGPRRIPRFIPNDLITIWMQRLAGYPIQVFTGYLDSTPYMQPYPGTVEVTASCTLKRLKRSYFDPGLQFFRDWVQKHNADWIVNPADGSAINPYASIPSTVAGDNFGGDVNDAGIGGLLADFMKDIAGWDPAHVFVGAIDPDLSTRAAQMLKKINQNAEQDYTAVAQWLGSMMGVKGVSTTDAAGLTASGAMSAQLRSVINAIKTSHILFSPEVLLTASTLLTNNDPSYTNRKKQEVGLFRIKKNISIYGNTYTPEVLLKPDKSTVAYCYLLTQTLAARTKQDSGGSSPGAVNEVQHIDLNTLGNAFNSALQQVNGGDLDLLRTLINTTSSTNYSADEVKVAWNHATKDLVSLVNATQAASIPTLQIIKRDLTWDDSALLDILSPTEQSAAAQYSSAKNLSTTAGIAWYIKKHLGNAVQLVYPSDKRDRSTGSVFFISTGTSSQLQSSPTVSPINQVNHGASTTQLPGSLVAFNLLKGVKLPYVQYQGIDASQSLTTLGTLALHNGQSGTPNGMASWAGGWHGNLASLGSLAGTLGVYVNPNTTLPPTWSVPSGHFVGNQNGGASSNSNNPITATWSEIAQVSTDAAFVASLEFPASLLESQMLTGEKALLNDMCVFDAVQEFCSASMRCFCSLPDGSFCAFYPDYYGAYREPYWSVPDIEMTDFTIQLNDHNYVSHAYVVGDTGVPNGSIDSLDRIASRGVATLNMEYILESFIDSSFINAHADVKGEPSTAKGLISANAMLQRYGASVYKEENPIIRNAAYEFLLAYQRFMQFWASQFATNIPFTFQPEIMAGGIIWFPQFNLQTYVESVTHTFDYESGFETTAVLSSPAIPNVPGARKDQPDISQWPGMAFAGTPTVAGG